MSTMHTAASKCAASFLAILCGAFALAAAPDVATPQPMNKQAILTMLAVDHAFWSPREITREVRQRGADFQLQPETERELRKAGAKDAVIEAVRASYRAPAVEEGASAPFPYFDPISSANAAVAAKECKQAVESLEQAAKLEPDSPLAYEYLAFLRLTIMSGRKLWSPAGTVEPGQKNAREAIERGGEAAFPVRHMKGTVFPRSGGFLYIRQLSVAYVPLPMWKADDDTFESEKSSLTSVKVPGHGYEGGSWELRSRGRTACLQRTFLTVS